MKKEELQEIINKIDELINEREEFYDGRSDAHKKNTNTLITIQLELQEIVDTDEDFK